MAKQHVLDFLRDQWLERASSIDLPKQGTTRTDALLNFLAGAGNMAKRAGRNDDVNDISGVMFFVSIRGANDWEKTNKR